MHKHTCTLCSQKNKDGRDERAGRVYSEDYEGSGLWCWPGCCERGTGGPVGGTSSSKVRRKEAKHCGCFDLHVRLRVDGQTIRWTNGWMVGSSPILMARHGVIMFWWNRYNVFCGDVCYPQGLMAVRWNKNLLYFQVILRIYYLSTNSCIYNKHTYI